LRKYSFGKKISKPNCEFRKSTQKQFRMKESDRKMLLKLTPVVSFTNILEAFFADNLLF